MSLSLVETKLEISRVTGLIEQNRVQDAQVALQDLIDGQNRDVLALTSPELRDVIGKFQRKRKRELTLYLESSLDDSKSRKPVRNHRYESKFKSSHIPIERYAALLSDLRDHHIFQWATHYREQISFIFSDMLANLREQELWNNEVEEVSELFSMHAMEIYAHGYKHLAQTGNSAETAERKSVNGLKRFIYLLMTLYLENRDSVTTAKQSRLLREITSSLIIGVLRGYGAVKFGNINGTTLLKTYHVQWMQSLGFVTGQDASQFLLSFPSEDVLEAAFTTVVPTLIALDLLSHRYQNRNFILPRLSRTTANQPSRLEMTLTAVEDSVVRELVITCFLEDEVSDKFALQNTFYQRSTVAIARLSQSTKIWADDENLSQLVDAREIPYGDEQARNFAEHILSTIEKEVATLSSKGQQRTIHNYPRDFPLDDPEFRRLFLVERNSVKKLLQQLEKGYGVHLWCSVRRSGKTTSVSELIGSNYSSVVISQTMDHQPDQPDLNILERRVREALIAGEPISADFFEKIISECLSSQLGTKNESQKTVLIVDEYESLFGLLAAMTDINPHLRFLITLPLLSQMVGFCRKNLIILMGQRPDAHFILSSQNQLSPLVRQHNFPLFEHVASGTDTEFSQFLRRVLAEIPFKPSFADSVYQETSGHPFLTVNLMIDLCEWLIENGTMADEIELSASVFDAFSKARLTRAILERSRHYSFFRTMLADFMSAKCRKQEPWLHAIAHILHQIGRKHNRIFSCAISSYEVIAKPFGASAGMTPDVMLTSATMANFLKVEAGQVKPAIRLMGRLAASVYAEIN